MLHVTVETAECSCSPDVPLRTGTNRALTTIVYWGNVGIVEKKNGNDYLGFNIEYYRGIGITLGHFFKILRLWNLAPE